MTDYVANYAPNNFEVFVSDGGARSYTDLLLAAHNADALAHTAVAHTWTAGQTFNITAAAADEVTELDFQFSGTRRARIGQQANADYSPQSGFFEIVTGDAARRAQFTMYQYGTTIRTYGTSAHLFELFLGSILSAGYPTLSVRHNGGNLGAQIHARNAADTYGVGADFTDATNPRFQVFGTPAGLRLSVLNDATDGVVDLVDGYWTLALSGQGALDNFTLKRSTTTFLTVNNAGRMGLGIAPAVMFHILGDAAATEGMIIQCANASGAIARYRDHAYNREPLAVFADGNIAIGLSIGFGGGAGVVAIKDAATAPTTNPTGGGILYSEGGALKWRGPSGTVTPIGAA